MCGGRARRRFIAYVGIADALKQRIAQHLIRRDSSIVTNVSAVGLNPNYVSEVWWWEHAEFNKRDVLEAAELVAFGVLDPALRSRGAITERAKALYRDESWRVSATTLLSGNPTGVLVIPTLQDALERIADLEMRVEALEKRYRNI